MMDARSRARLAIARRATNALRHRDFRGSLAECPDGVSRPVIAALPNDRMSDVFRQLVRYDCSATLVTEAADGGMAIVAVYPAEAGAATDDASDRQPRAGANDCPVHQDTEIGMLLLHGQAPQHPVQAHRARM